MCATRLEHASDDTTYANASDITIIDSDAQDVVDISCSRAHRKIGLSKAQAFLTRSVTIWSICELVLEVMTASTASECLALIIGRSIWISLAIGTMRDHHFTRRIFLFLCGASALAVVVQLPTAFETSKIFFGISLVDCLTKSATLLAFIL